MPVVGEFLHSHSEDKPLRLIPGDRYPVVTDQVLVPTEMQIWTHSDVIRVEEVRVRISLIDQLHHY